MSKIHNIGTEMQKIVIKNKKLSSYNLATMNYKIEVTAGTDKLSIPP